MKRAAFSPLLALLLAACSGLATPERPTDTPLPTPALADIQAALTGTAAEVMRPTAPPTLTEPAEPGTATPGLPTPIPPSATIPPLSEGPQEEVILILEPGFSSQVISPLHVAGMADPTFEQNLVAQVLGESGEVLTTMPTIIGADVGQRGPFAVDVAYAVGADQPGRIVVYSDSPRDGGLVHLASVEVTLLAGGAATINPPEEHGEEIVIHEPALSATISGGTAHVSGLAGPTFEQTIVIEVHDADGNVVGSTPTVIAADLGAAGEFAADVAYAVEAEQPGRIVIFHESARDGRTLHLASVEVTLAP